MKQSSLAGKPDEPAMLVNVPRLITAYYTEVPDPAVPEQRVIFGTSGHRGTSLAKSFNEWHILAISQAVCLYRRQQRLGGPLFLGMDTHALSVPALSTALEVLAANGVEVMISEGDEYTPTPAISHAILTFNRDRKTALADGIVITPSHNPPEDGGFKYNPPHGGPAEKIVADWIEAKANELISDGVRGVKRVPVEMALRTSTHRYDYLSAYVAELGSVIDMEAINRAKIRLGVDPLGGAGVHYWGRIAEHYGLNLSVVDDTVDPTFRFMTVDWDGRIRMDPSSPYAMRRLLALKDQFDIAFGCDTDHDRHGIVTRRAGLLHPNHFLSAAVLYLAQHRPNWPPQAMVGKTVVSSQMFDRVTARVGRKLYEVPVGFRWFVEGLLARQLGFAGEESAGASFLRRDGTVWTTDKDGIIPALLAAEITARMDRDPGEIYAELTRELGNPIYDRIMAPATPAEKEILRKLSPQQIQITDLAGEPIKSILTRAPGNGAPIGGLKVIAENGWFAVRPSGTENLYRIYAESFLGREHLDRILEQTQAIVTEAVASVQHRTQSTSMTNPEKQLLSSRTMARITSHRFLSSGVQGLDSLEELALDLRWSWNHTADEIWRQLDPDLWQLTHNPWVVLQTVSRDQLHRLLGEPGFRKMVEDIVAASRETEQAPTWFQQNHSSAPLTFAAYFSMEFMLSEALPIYSGGLGNVAGDQLKAASDLGVPIIGVGLLYQRGYFRQVIGKDGTQEALFPYNDPGQLPITPLRDPNGEWLRLKVQLPGYAVWLRAWQIQVGRVKLYLLDSNDAANFPAHRGITSELYAAGPELRLRQELMLGIGGWRLLAALGLKPEVCHLNEGHSAFVVLERARHFMEETGHPFEVALSVTRAGNLFTTHTAVPAGFDRFPPELMEKYLARYTQKLGIPFQHLLALGRLNPNDSSESFNMAYLAIRGSGAVNGVSRLHGCVSRRLFAPLFPRWPQDEIPVEHVTNGVHMPSWDSACADALWTDICGKNRWLQPQRTLNCEMRLVSNAQLWQLRNASCEGLIEYARERLARELAVAGASLEAVDQAKHLFDPNILTLGFARRFVTYKRPNLLLHDPDRLLRLLTNKERPVQLILAGKAHPADRAGQALIQQWVRFIMRPEARPHVMFLADHDMLLTEQLVQGADVWLNTPRRPWEACGTSGMKPLVNGGLNLSELDGWWAEAYSPKVGWALGDGQDHGDDPSWDAAEASELYNLLEREVIPEFYNRDRDGIPVGWVARMRESMADLTPRFSATRMVPEYTERYYLPAAIAYSQRAANGGVLGREIVDWRRTLEQKWGSVRFGEMKVETAEGRHIFEVQVYLNGLDPKTIKVELYADEVNGESRVRQEMTPIRYSEEPASGSVYRTELPATRPATDYTPRVIPFYPGVAVPLEASSILWQH